jgi:predicted TIM-barrel fold metal-dependent hydrolase
MDALKIVDAHHHFWDLSRNRYPWLQDEPPIPFRYGDYRAISRNYLPANFRNDTAEFNIVGSIHIEAESDPGNPTAETAWLSTLHEEYGLPSACVAQAWLHHDDVETVLAAQAAFPLVRGIRHKPPEPPGYMQSDAWRRGYALLSKYGLSFDLQTPWTRLAEAAGLARDFPDTQIILNHTGLPADRSVDGIDGWRTAMRTVAAQPNIAVKISGIGVPAREWTVELNQGVVLNTIDIFGVERCMFASNYPVDSIVASYATIFGGFLDITAGFSLSERKKMFCANAVHYYRLKLD